jgi:hypothetical protein
MTTPARTRDQKSARIDDQSPTLTLREDYEHVADEHTRSPARPGGYLCRSEGLSSRGCLPIHTTQGAGGVPS